MHKREANNLRCESFAGCFEKHLKAGIQKKTFEFFFLKKHFGKYCGKDQWGRIETSKPLEANRKDINKEKN